MQNAHDLGLEVMGFAGLPHERTWGWRLLRRKRRPVVPSVGQLVVARHADQPTMLRPIQAPMEGEIELGAGDRLAHQGEDRRNAAAVSRVTRPEGGNAGSPETPFCRQKG